MFIPARADRRYASKRQVSVPYNLPAPTGGINARDAFTDMDAHDAVALTNIFPEASYVAVRKGYGPWATGMTNPVRSLMTWNGLTGADKLFAGSGTKIWDVSAAGAATGTTASSLLSVDFQWTSIKTPGGMYLVVCNGKDSVRVYDGTSWTTPNITGATSSTFANVVQFKERLWFSVVDSLDVYYLDLESIAGAAIAFPLGAVFHRGGYVIGLGTFSNDAGEGPDDYLGIVSSNGEVAVYQGTDPTSANTFALVGRFDVGFPIGRRNTIRWNGDMGVLTQDGVISMKAALRFSRESIQKAAITGKIQTLFSQYAQSYKTNFGWMQMTYPHSRYLIVNVPTVANMAQVQLVMNTITGSWCQFSGMNAGCWGTANDLLYFGGDDGVVYQADDGYLDNGGNINWSIQTSWQMKTVGGPSNKLFTMVRPTLLVGAGVTFAIGVHVDFVVSPPSGALLALSPPGSVMTWPWTWPGTWGGQNIIDQRWQSAGAIGTWAQIHLEGTVNGGAFQCNSFDLIGQLGGPL